MSLPTSLQTLDWGLFCEPMLTGAASDTLDMQTLNWGLFCEPIIVNNFAEAVTAIDIIAYDILRQEQYIRGSFGYAATAYDAQRSQEQAVGTFSYNATAYDILSQCGFVNASQAGSITCYDILLGASLAVGSFTHNIIARDEQRSVEYASPAFIYNAEVKDISVQESRATIGSSYANIVAYSIEINFIFARGTVVTSYSALNYLIHSTPDISTIHSTPDIVLIHSDPNIETI